MSTEYRKEFADLRMRPNKVDNRYRGIARIPQARAWMLRKLDQAASIADGQHVPADQRTKAKAEVRSLTDRLKRLGVINDRDSHNRHRQATR